MIKVPMGHIDYVTAAGNAFTSGGVIGGTSMYTVDNANWVNSLPASQIPFTDEYSYLSLGTSGGQDTYTMQPGGVIDRGNGVWWIVFYMPGDEDAQTNTSGTLWDSVRIFQYDQSTQIAMQILKKTCIVYTNIQIPQLFFLLQDWSQAISVTETSGSVTVHIHGYQSDNLQTVYSTDFLTFSPPV
jgi:hypothetical protein